jgi:hypothetical protein
VCGDPATPVQFPTDGADLPGELGAAAVDTRLDRALGQLQPIGDFLVGQLLDIAHHHRRPQRLRQRRERLAQQRDAILLLERGERAGLGGNRRQLVRIDGAINRLPLLPDAAVVIDAQVAGDADQPGLEIGAAVEGAERLEDFQEDVLGEVLGFLVLADEFVGDVEDLAAVLPDDRLPRLLVAAQALLDQRFDFSRRHGRGGRRCRLVR